MAKGSQAAKKQKKDTELNFSEQSLKDTEYYFENGMFQKYGSCQLLDLLLLDGGGVWYRLIQFYIAAPSFEMGRQGEKYTQP